MKLSKIISRKLYSLMRKMSNKIARNIFLISKHGSFHHTLPNATVSSRSLHNHKIASSCSCKRKDPYMLTSFLLTAVNNLSFPNKMVRKISSVPQRCTFGLEIVPFFQSIWLLDKENFHVSSFESKRTVSGLEGRIGKRCFRSKHSL